MPIRDQITTDQTLPSGGLTMWLKTNYARLKRVYAIGIKQKLQHKMKYQIGDKWTWFDTALDSFGKSIHIQNHRGRSMQTVYTYTFS